MAWLSGFRPAMPGRVRTETGPLVNPPLVHRAPSPPLRLSSLMRARVARGGYSKTNLRRRVAPALLRPACSRRGREICGTPDVPHRSCAEVHMVAVEVDDGSVQLLTIDVESMDRFPSLQDVHDRTVVCPVSWDGSVRWNTARVRSGNRNSRTGSLSDLRTQLDERRAICRQSELAAINRFQRSRFLRLTGRRSCSSERPGSRV